MRSPLHLLFCGVVVVGLTTAAALILGVRSEMDSLGLLVARLASRAQAEFSETVLLATVLSQHQSIVDVASGSPESKALDRLVIQTGLSAILVHDDQAQILAAGYRRPISPTFVRSGTDTIGLSKRFVRYDGQSAMFVVSHPIKGISNRAILTLYQPLEDQALYWRAISENLRLIGPDGETLYAHDRGFGWSPLVMSVRAQTHGTELTLTRDPWVLGKYAALGFFTGVILVLISFLWWFNTRRRDELAQARLGALADDAQRLEQMVTARTRALRDSQSQVIQTAKFKVLNDMSSGLAHEFSQPLFALEARLDTLALELGENTQIAALDKARAQTRRMGQILNSLKAFAREDSAAPDLIALSPVINSALELLDYRLAGANVTVQHVLPEMPVLGVANATRLSQVVVNIVSNSLDAMSRGGEISIRYDKGPSITIQDNGPGFADMAEALEPFATTKAEQNGLGLGLSISRDIMQSFGGGLEISNAKARGAVVRLAFTAEERVLG